MSGTLLALMKEKSEGLRANSVSQRRGLDCYQCCRLAASEGQHGDSADGEMSWRYRRVAGVKRRHLGDKWRGGTQRGGRYLLSAGGIMGIRLARIEAEK